MYVHQHNRDKRGPTIYVRTWDWFEHIGYECVHDALIEEMVTHSDVGDELLALAQCHQLRQWEGLHIFILAVTTESRIIAIFNV